MRRAFFYAETLLAVAALVVAWAGLADLPPTGWIYNSPTDVDAWTPRALGMVLAGLFLGWRMIQRIRARRMPLPPIPGLGAKTGGPVALAMTAIATLMLYWWIDASREQLPVGPVGWALGIVALGTLSFGAVAAGAIWSGFEREREVERAEVHEEEPVGL